MDRRPFLRSLGPALGAVCGCLATSGDDARATRRPDHHLYLANLSEDSRRVELTVARRETGETVVDGIYEIPDERGGELREIGRWEETYDVTATVDSSVTETFAWETESCTNSEAPNGSRNGSVRIDSDADDLSFVTDSCDEIVASTEVATGPASAFEVGETA